MFVMECMKKIRHVIEENGKREPTKHKNLSNIIFIEVDNTPSSLKILNL